MVIVIVIPVDDILIGGVNSYVDAYVDVGNVIHPSAG